MCARENCVELVLLGGTTRLARLLPVPPPRRLLQAPPHRSASSPSAPPAPNSSPDTTVLKRRRPAPLLVPAAAAEAMLDAAAHGTMNNEVAEGRRGKRLEMEDRHVAVVGLGGDPHAVTPSSIHHSTTNLQPCHACTPHHHTVDRPCSACSTGTAEFAADNMPRIMAEELERAQGGRAAVDGAVRRAYLRTDDEFSREQQAGSGGGACCVTALLHLVVSGAGDCRGGKAEALTDDHRASRQDERDRIESQSGLVLNCRGTWRVQGSLAVSRGTRRAPQAVGGSGPGDDDGGRGRRVRAAHPRVGRAVGQGGQPGGG